MPHIHKSIFISREREIKINADNYGYKYTYNTELLEKSNIINPTMKETPTKALKLGANTHQSQR